MNAAFCPNCAHPLKGSAPSSKIAGSSREPKASNSDTYSWRSSSANFESIGKPRHSRSTMSVLVAVFIAMSAIFGYLQISPERISTPSFNNSNASSATVDEACYSMKSADMAVAVLGKKVLGGSATSRDVGSVKAALARLNVAYRELDGAFYSYLVSQGNAMDLLVRSIESGDYYSAGVAVQSYLDGDKYSTYCR